MLHRLLNYRTPHIIAFAFYLSVVVYGITRAIRLAWVCDDAFISFRYAWNLARGKGLVFNAGEYVEGFTNLLWTLALSPFFALNIDIVSVSTGLGVVCYMLLLMDYYRQGRRILSDFGGAQDHNEGWNLWPWTLPAVAAHHHLHVFATSGLETSLFTLLVTAGILRIIRTKNDHGRVKFGFALLALACLTRPDGILIYGTAGAFVALGDLRRFESGNISLRTITPAWFFSQLRTHLFFVITVGASFVFRLVYYGELLPNTFYAKSAHDPYFGQGLYYAGLYFGAYWICVLLFASLIVFAFRRTDEKFTMIAGVCSAWILYVLWVGGDFMFGRFLVPITPLVYFGGEIAIRDLVNKWIDVRPSRPITITGKRIKWWIPAIALLAATLLRYDPYEGRPLPVIGYVGEEYKIYTTKGMRQLRETALATRATMQSADPVVGFVGAQAALIFYWDISTAIEAQTGLTDRIIARMPLNERGWIGHEKNAPLTYLQERGVSFLLKPPPPERRQTEWNVMKIQGLIGEFEIIKYEPEVMEILRSDSRFEIPDRTE